MIVYLFILTGTNIEQAGLPPISSDSYYLEEVQAFLGKGIKFPNRSSQITFRSSTQDVLTELGPPDDIYFKEIDQMKIYLGNSSSEYEPPFALTHTDYFYNYYYLGIDFLFDRYTHLVKKIVLHTNITGHFDFHRYRKCNFLLVDLRSQIP